MKYLFLMYYKYYSEGKHTESIPYFSALCAVTLYMYIFLLLILQILNIDFKIPYWGIERWLNYILIAIVLLPIQIIFYCIFPPKVMKQLSMSFKYNIWKNIFWITVLIVMFFSLFIFNPKSFFYHL